MIGLKALDSEMEIFWATLSSYRQRKSKNWLKEYSLRSGSGKDTRKRMETLCERNNINDFITGAIFGVVVGTISVAISPLLSYGIFAISDRNQHIIGYCEYLCESNNF